MPLYEYKCNECGKVFEKIRSVSDADAPICCVKCESPNTGRKLSAFFAHGTSRVSSNQNSGCGGCGGGNCGSCRH